MNYISNCCSAPMDIDQSICPECKEGCGAEIDESTYSEEQAEKRRQNFLTMIQSDMVYGSELFEENIEDTINKTIEFLERFKKYKMEGK